MRWTLYGLIVVILVGCVAIVAAEEVIGGIMFNTGPFVCNSGWHTRQWRNDLPFTINVVSMSILHARDYGVIADYFTNVVREDNSWLAWFSQDAYDEAAAREKTTDYGKRWQSLNPGETVLLQTICTQFGGPESGRGHTIVDFRFTKPGQPR